MTDKKLGCKLVFCNVCTRHCPVPSSEIPSWTKQPPCHCTPWFLPPWIGRVRQKVRTQSRSCPKQVPWRNHRHSSAENTRWSRWLLPLLSFPSRIQRGSCVWTFHRPYYSNQQLQFVLKAGCWLLFPRERYMHPSEKEFRFQTALEDSICTSICQLSKYDIFWYDIRFISIAIFIGVYRHFRYSAVHKSENHFPTLETYSIS